MTPSCASSPFSRSSRPATTSPAPSSPNASKSTSAPSSATSSASKTSASPSTPPAASVAPIACFPASAFPRSSLPTKRPSPSHSAFAPATEGALAKLGRVLPEALRESLLTIEDVVAVEPGPWVVSTSAESLILAASAIRACRRIRFTYLSNASVRTRREIKPYAVLHTDGRWYLIGHCISRKAIRTFRLDRVTQLALRTKTFKRPKKFDARTYLNQRMPFVQSDHQIDVWIDLPIAEATRTFAPWRVATEDATEAPASAAAATASNS
jgi:predicted DNA-binding transcriptional regulator YafY